MQLTSLSALTVFITSALAADCVKHTQGSLSAYAPAYWSAREQMCGNSACAYQQACATTGTTTVNGVKVTVTLNRWNTGGSKGFKDCWDATENIIDQCVLGQESDEGEWQANGQFYKATAWFTAA
ncbi:hypothetical protein BGZ63DRAFT_488881 [Mariannaea sp. PMI_226]|nr:hypothetical protein BGZ63DRAFT_488881 [Mariannaea sp. PMI_226]